MFTWITQGVPEPYLSTNHQEFKKKVSATYHGIPDKSIREREGKTRPQKNTLHHNSNHESSNPYVAEDHSQEEFAIPVFAREIMVTNPITSNMILSISEGEEILNKHKIKYLPILDRDKVIIGIVSQKDILQHTILLYRNTPLEIEKAQLGDIMKKKVLSGFPDTAIREIAKIMVEERVGCLPIISKDKSELVGIITRSDILRSVMVHTSLNLYV